jgi:hypothetical protein
MRMNTRDIAWKLEYEPFDQVCGPFDGNFDLREFSTDIHRTVWDGNFGTIERFSVRRKIERRNDMRDMYSKLDGRDGRDRQNK